MDGIGGAGYGSEVIGLEADVFYGKVHVMKM